MRRVKIEPQPQWAAEREPKPDNPPKGRADWHRAETELVNRVGCTEKELFERLGWTEHVPGGWEITVEGGVYIGFAGYDWFRVPKAGPWNKFGRLELVTENDSIYEHPALERRAVEECGPFANEDRWLGAMIRAYLNITGRKSYKVFDEPNVIEVCAELWRAIK